MMTLQLAELEDTPANPVHSEPCTQHREQTYVDMLIDRLEECDINTFDATACFGRDPLLASLDELTATPEWRNHNGTASYHNNHSNCGNLSFHDARVGEQTISSLGGRHAVLARIDATLQQLDDLTRRGTGPRRAGRLTNPPWAPAGDTEQYRRCVCPHTNIFSRKPHCNCSRVCDHGYCDVLCIVLILA